MKKLFYFFAGLLMLISTNSRADEGMWIPLLVERLNYVDMQEMGLQLFPITNSPFSFLGEGSTYHQPRYPINRI